MNIGSHYKGSKFNLSDLPPRSATTAHETRAKFLFADCGGAARVRLSCRIGKATTKNGKSAGHGPKINIPSLDLPKGSRTRIGI